MIDIYCTFFCLGGSAVDKEHFCELQESDFYITEDTLPYLGFRVCKIKEEI
jgi:hypothetical protein